MSKLFSELTQEAKIQQDTVLGKTEPKPDNDTATSNTDTANRRRNDVIEIEKLQTIIEEISTIKVGTHGTPVRLSEVEKQDIEDFIYITLRKRGLQGKSVSGAKLMRYALRYVMKVHQTEFVASLVEALKKEEKLSI